MSRKPPSESGRAPVWKRHRWVLAVILFVGLWLVGHFTGLDHYFEREQVRSVVEQAGPWGLVLFIGIFSVGELLHVPGLVFVGAAMFAFGRAAGVGASLAGAIASVTVSFIVVRRVGGQPLAGIEDWLDERARARGGLIKRVTGIMFGFVRRMLLRLESKPITSVTLLRLVLWMAPFLNYLLAMTKVRLRDYVIGSALGLLLPVTLAALFFGWIFG